MLQFPGGFTSESIGPAGILKFSGWSGRPGSQAQNFVQSPRAERAPKRFAGFGVIGGGHAMHEKPRQHSLTVSVIGFLP
jgi:hypothetical protein